MIILAEASKMLKEISSSISIFTSTLDHALEANVSLEKTTRNFKMSQIYCNICLAISSSFTKVNGGILAATFLPPNEQLPQKANSSASFPLAWDYD